MKLISSPSSLSTVQLRKDNDMDPEKNLETSFSANSSARERTVIRNISLLDEKTLLELKASFEELESSKDYDRMIIGRPPLEE